MFSQPIVNSPKEALQIITDFTSSHHVDAPTDEQIDHLFRTKDIGEVLKETSKVCKEYQSVQMEKNIDIAKRYMKTAEQLKDHIMHPFPMDRLNNLNSAILHLPPEETRKLASCYTKRAELLIQKDDLIDAITNCDSAIVLRPRCQEAFLLRIRAVYKLGQKKLALHLLDSYKNVYRKADIDASFKKEMKELKKEIKRDIKYGTGMKEKEVDIKKPAFDYNLKCSDSLTVDRRSNKDKTFCLQAINKIENETVLFEECPAVMIYKGEYVLKYCNDCGSECSNSFLPCYQCVDTVFCSETCRSQGTGPKGLHAQECLFTEFLRNRIGSAGSQVYRHLSSIGLDNFATIDEIGDSFDFDLPNLVSNVSRSVHSSRQNLVRFYSMSQRAMRKRFLKFFPNRSAEEISVALMIIGLYLFKNPEYDWKNLENLKNIVQMVAIDVAKVKSFEFTYSKSVKDNAGKTVKIPCASYQTLLASNLAPSCYPNATWEFNGTAFVVRAQRDIEVGEEITITYGTFGSFMPRQKGMQNFSTLCSCANCQQEVCKEFAIKCTGCKGPIPFQDTLFESGVCIGCMERDPKFNVVEARQFYTRFQYLQSFLNLHVLPSQVDMVLNLDNAVTELYDRMYPECTPLLKLTQKLALDYAEFGSKSMSAAWYQWMKSAYHIDLSLVGDETGIESFQIQAQFLKVLLYTAKTRKEVSMLYSAEAVLERLESIRQNQPETLTCASNEAISESILENTAASIAEFREELNSVREFLRTNGIEVEQEESAREESQEISEEVPELVAANSVVESASDASLSFDETLEFEIVGNSQIIDDDNTILGRIPSFLSDSSSASILTATESFEGSAESTEQDRTEDYEEAQNLDEEDQLGVIITETESITLSADEVYNDSVVDSSESKSLKHSRSTIGGTISESSGEVSDIDQ